MGEDEINTLLIILDTFMSASFFVLAILADEKTIKALSSITAVCWLISCIPYYNRKIGNLITTLVQGIGLQKTKKNKL